MRIVLHVPFAPDRPTAERELALRIAIAAGRKGWSVEIAHSLDPADPPAADLVVALHQDAPKLTGLPTVGCLWNPPAHIEDDEAALARTLSYDGFLTAGPAMDSFVRACLFPTHRPVPTAPFHPATHDTALEPRVTADSRLFYVGSNWDGRRFAALFERLAGAGLLAAHGPEEGWRPLGSGYAGPLPFDGLSTLEAANRCGIGLCLHLPGHTAAGVPNMRIFELAAAGTLIVCGRHPFVEAEFGDSVLTVDPEAPAEEMADAVTAHVRWARANPEAATAMAVRSQTVFRERLTLDRLMEGWPGLLAGIRTACGFEAAPEKTAGETVGYVLPVAGAEPTALSRTLSTLAAQSHPAIVAILAGDAPSLVQAERIARDAGLSGERLRRIAVPDDASPATALWAGLRAADTGWIGTIQAGDLLFPNHTASLLGTARRAGADLVFAHSVTGNPANDPADDPAGTGERRAPVPADTLYRGELPGDRLSIPPAAFLARAGLLDDRLLRDPGLGMPTAMLHLVRRLAAKAAAGQGAVSSWLTTLSACDPALPEAERRLLDRLERFDPAHPRPVPAAGRPTGFRRPAPPGDIGAAILDGVLLLAEPADFAVLDPARPIHIFGSGQGGRLVQLELMRHPGLRIAGFLDSRASGTAWDLPVRRLGEIVGEGLAQATVVVASQHVVEILHSLKRLGFLQTGRGAVFNAYPYIAARTGGPAAEALSIPSPIAGQSNDPSRGGKGNRCRSGR